MYINGIYCKKSFLVLWIFCDKGSRVHNKALKKNAHHCNTRQCCNAKCWREKTAAAVSIRKIKDSVPVRRMMTIFLLVVAMIHSVSGGPGLL